MRKAVSLTCPNLLRIRYADLLFSVTVSID
jgi:hypothetical protein